MIAPTSKLRSLCQPEDFQEPASQIIPAALASVSPYNPS